MTRTIVWQSNSPLVGTGYGNQTNIFTKLLADDGWKVYVAANYGLAGSLIEFDDITILPKGLDTWGNDTIKPHFNRYKPDIYFTLQDIWVLKPEAFAGIPLVSWVPVDHDPAPPAVVDMALKIPFPVAMSKFGESTLRDYAVDPYYIPHGIVTNIFEPGDRKIARDKFKIEDDTFFAIMNAANKGTPSRKGFEATFKAWAHFINKYPKSLLYVHSMPLPVHHGCDLIRMAGFYGITEENLRFPDVYDYSMGTHNWNYLVTMYNAADCMVSPSRGEGFGIPVVEAHACGCPTVVNDFSAQSELGASYKIPIDRMDDMIFTEQGAEWAVPRPSAIYKALEYMYEHRNKISLREEVRENAMKYDALHVYENHMLPVFEAITNFK